MYIVRLNKKTLILKKNPFYLYDLTFFFYLLINALLYLILDEMLEAESRGVAGRVSDLERRVLEQGDELVCLKATLAEALRRLSLLEGMRLAQQVPSSATHNTAPNTPIRNGNSYKEMRIRHTNYNSSQLVFNLITCNFLVDLRQNLHTYFFKYK